MLADIAQLLADQRAPVVSPHCHQLYPAIGKIHYLQGAGLLHQSINVIGDDLLGTDDDVDGNSVLAEHAGVGCVLLGAHSRDFGGGVEQAAGDLAGDHVDFIITGDGDQHIGVLNAGAQQNRRM